VEQVSISGRDGQTPSDHHSAPDLLNRLTLAKAIAKANLRRVEAGEKPITMNSFALQAGVAPITVARLARTDDKAASTLSLDHASKIVMVLDCEIEDLPEVVDDTISRQEPYF